MLDDLFERDTLTLDQLHLLFPEFALYNGLDLKTAIQWKLHDELQVHCLDANEWTCEGIATGATALWLKIISKPAIPLIRQKKEEFVTRIYKTLKVRSEQHQSPLEKLYNKMNGSIVPVSSSASNFPVAGVELEETPLDQQYKCYICTLVFTNKDDLVNHFSADHNSFNIAPLSDQFLHHDPLLQDPNFSYSPSSAFPRRGRGRPRKYSQQSSGRTLPAQPARPRKTGQPVPWHHLSSRRRKPYKPTHHRTPVEHEVCKQAIEEVDKNFRCKSCGYTSPYIGNMRKHVIRRHTDIRPFTCPVCDYKCAVKQDFDLHQERCRVKLEVVAASDEDAGSDIRDLTAKAVFRCDQCTYETDDYSTLQFHISNSHDVCNIKSTANGGVSLSIDAATASLSEPKLNSGVTMHSTEQNIPNDEAQNMLKIKDDLSLAADVNLAMETSSGLDHAAHLASLPIDNGKNLPDSTVRYTATGLKRDLVSKKYICNHCKYSTKFNGNLKKHCQRVHPQFPWEPDLYLKRQVSEIAVDAEMNAKKESHQWPTTRKRARNSWNHSNSPRKRHNCPHCHYTSDFRGNISKHMGRVHSDKSQSVVKTEVQPEVQDHDSQLCVTNQEDTAVSQVGECTAVFPETI